MGLGVAVASTGVASTAADAATLPSVVTGPPSDVTVAGATLSGDVDPNGAAATYDFAYGTSLDYGLHTASVTAGAGTHEYGVASHLDGLTPGTTYHYRLDARNRLGATFGSDATFKTPAHAPSIVKSSASSVGDSSADVVAEIDANGLASTWYVRYGTSVAFGLASTTRAIGSSTSAVTVSLSLRGLAAHSTCYFEVVAMNAAGASLGPQVSLVTAGSPIVVTQSIRDLATKSVTLDGTVNPDGHETSWYFQYGTTPAYGTSTKVGGAGRSMDDVDVARAIADLIPNTVYHFRLVAVSVDGTTVGSDTSFETPGPSLSSSSSAVNFGTMVTLSGIVPSGATNETVAIYGQTAADPSFVEFATVLTGANGAWAYVVQPGIATNYKAIWHSEISPTISIGVSPAVTLREPSHGRFVAFVKAESRFNGRLVRLQRLEHGVWRTIAARRLNADSSASFRPSLPAGRSRLRVYLTAFQAGPGYLAGLSGVHLYKL
jgi:hypothetical protein